MHMIKMFLNTDICQATENSVVCDILNIFKIFKHLVEIRKGELSVLVFEETFS